MATKWEDTPSVRHPLALTSKHCANQQYVAGWNGALRLALEEGKSAYAMRVPKGLDSNYRDGWSAAMLMLALFDRPTKVCA